MPIYDFECGSCEAVTERYAKIEEEVLPCEQCASDAHRIISASGHYCGNQGAGWLKSVIDVVDKDPTKPHCVEFIKNPTRANHRKWMEGEGIRPMEPGEKPITREPVDDRKIRQEVWEKHQDRMRIEV
jgi:putative FmdB family regulatory protein